MFPEFALIHCRVVRDFYHKYTVDEHTLLAIRNVESLWNPANPSRQRFGSILHELHTPELLTLALLFHDVGKWRDADHAQESLQPRAEHARSAGARAPTPAETVEFLIRNHLQMSQVAFRRDVDDPHVVGQFADLVGTEEHLKMLCLMTLADVGAVSPDTLTPWKEDLLWRLYVDTYNRLTLGYADELLQKDPARPRGGRRRPSGRHLRGGADDGFSTGCRAATSRSSAWRRSTVTSGWRAASTRTRCTRSLEQARRRLGADAVVTLDKPYLFSNVSGVLSYFGMDIHRGQAMTTPEGLVLDVVRVLGRGRLPAEERRGARRRSTRLLESVVAGTVDVPALLRGKERSVVHRPAPAVAPSCASTTSIRAGTRCSRSSPTMRRAALPHQPGDLGQGCDVDLVLIATEGKKAVDVLHVTKRGRKLPTPRAGLAERSGSRTHAGGHT